MTIQTKISASVLTADLSRLAEAVAAVESAGVDMLHIDVMDGIFVPPLTIGNAVVKSLRDKSPLIFDAHLMVVKPQRLIPLFAEAGSDMISIHVESDCDVPQVLRQIRDLGKKAGVAVNPTTPIESVFDCIGSADLFVIMSVEPGYGGQAFIPESLDKIKALREESRRRGIDVTIQVDGGINDKTAPNAVKAGADILVSGAYLFNSPDMAESVRKLRD